jgi:arylsulfatase A-like enzyme
MTGMTSPTSPSTVKILGAHFCTGLIAGFVLSAAYFGLEVYLGCLGKHYYLGASLLRILFVYVAFGLTVGTLSGVVAGVVCGCRSRCSDPAKFVPSHIVFLIFVFAIMYLTRGYTVARLRSIPKSMDIIWFGLLLVGLIAVGLLVSRSLSGRRAFGRLGTNNVLPLAIFCVIVAGAIQVLADRVEGYLPPPRENLKIQGPNVVLIVLDALRADHLSSYGYQRDTSPNIDKLAKEGVLFLNAHSHGNRTVVAMPSMFTSLYPSFHGVISQRTMMSPLPADHTTLAEIFSNNGYSTVGLMNNVYLKEQFGLVRGFDRVEEYHFGRYQLGLYKILRHLRIIDRPKFVTNRYPDADEVTDVAIRWVHRLEDRPYFMYVHYMDTHHPYAPPPPYDGEFGSKSSGPSATELYEKTTQMIRHGPSVELEDSELARLKDYYDGSVKFADHEIGRLLEEVGKSETGRETIVIVTADHGDEFLEHGSLYHTNLVFEELIHVPLIVWSSERFDRGAKVGSMARHIDVLPTLAELIGSNVPAQSMGRSLVPLLQGEPDTVEVGSFAEGDFCASLNRNNWKIMRVDSTDSFLLFDLGSIPREKEDLSELYPEVFSAMRAELENYLERARLVKKARMGEADEETIRQLKSLGYL